MTNKYFIYVSRLLLVAMVVFVFSGFAAPQLSHAESVMRDPNLVAPGYDDSSAYGSNVMGTVTTMATAGDGTVYVGGYFGSINNQVRNNLAAYSSDGSLLPWSPNPDSNIHDVAVDGNTVYVLGGFSQIGGIARNSLAAISTSGQVLPWNPTFNGSLYPSQIIVGPNAIYIVGELFGANDSENSTTLVRVIAVDKSTGNTLWSVTGDGMVSKAALKDSILYLAGGFSQVNGQSRNSLASINTSNGQLTTWNPNVTEQQFDGYVSALTITGNTLYVGGGFDTIAGQTRHSLASFDLSSGMITAWQPGMTSNGDGSNYINSIVVNNGIVYAGGSFRDNINSAEYNLVLIDANGVRLYWPIDMMGNTASNSYYTHEIFALAIQNNYLYVGASEDFARYDLNATPEPTSTPPIIVEPPMPPAPVVVLPPNVHTGELVKFANSSGVYLVEADGLYLFSSFYTLQLYMGQSHEVVNDINRTVDPFTISQYSNADAFLGLDDGFGQPFVPGTLVNSNGTIFLIMVGMQIPFQNAWSFKGLGYSFSDVINADLSHYSLTQTQGIYSDQVPHTWGTWLDYNGTVYYSDETGMAAVPDWNTFLNNHGMSQLIKPMNQYDLDVYFANPNLPILQMYDQRVAYSPNDPPYVPLTPEQERDTTRVYDSYTVQYALENYFYDNNLYPNSLADLVPTYLDSVLAAPSPADGTCTDLQNTYTYQKSNNSTYQFSFCLGEAMDIYTAGVNTIHSPTPEELRDQVRLADIRQMASGLELYFNDHSQYPSSLTELTPTYLATLPTAPTPADGSCSASQNSYLYQRLTNTTYNLSFCLGGSTQGMDDGPQIFSEAGIQ